MEYQIDVITLCTFEREMMDRLNDTIGTSSQRSGTRICWMVIDDLVILWLLLVLDDGCYKFEEH